MKNYALLSFCVSFIPLTSHAINHVNSKENPKDSSDYHKFNICFTLAEIGVTVPFKENHLRDLPYGMNTYLYSPKGDIAAALPGIGLYYKNHWGISAIIFNFQGFSVPDIDFRNYIFSQYPNHFLSSAVQAHTYTLYKINYRLSYRFHKGHIIYEPQLQLGIDDYYGFDTHFILKEMGSNNFIEYDIKEANLRKRTYSYRAAIVARWCFSKSGSKWNIEPGLRLEYLTIPTNFNYTITSTPYNMPATVHEVNVKQTHPAIGITAVMSFFLK